MFRLFYTPTWFNEWEILFEFIIFIIALLIAGYSWRVYRINQGNRFAYFSLAFLLVALGPVFKILTSAILYFTPIREVAATVLMPVAGAHLEFSALLYRAGFFLQMLPVLGAWLLIFFISQKPRDRLHKFHELSQIALFIYLILLISFVSNFKYEVFYLTSAVLLSLITLNYYKTYLSQDKNRNTFQVMLAFLLIFLSNIFFVFVFATEVLYVVGEIFLLAGFLLLLYTYSRIIKSK